MSLALAIALMLLPSTESCAGEPSSNADIHNLSISAYSYQVADVGAAVYTSKWLTGVSSMTITVYESKRNQVASTSIKISNSFGTSTGYIYGLHSKQRYYVRFSVPLNCNRYSFNSTIL